MPFVRDTEMSLTASLSAARRARRLIARSCATEADAILDEPYHRRILSKKK